MSVSGAGYIGTTRRDKLAQVFFDQGFSRVSRQTLESIVGLCLNGGASASPGQIDAVLAAIDPQNQSSEEVGLEQLLGWLYPASGNNSSSEAAGTSASGGEALAMPMTHKNSLDGGGNAVKIAMMGELLEGQSTCSESARKFKIMAEKLAEDFRSRGRNPHAEAFIEQLCVERILEGCIFVGHVMTDLDSVAGAIGGAYLWRGQATCAERELNGEIKYALAFAGLEPPPFFDDVPGAAMPDESGELRSVCLVDHNEEKQMTDALRRDKQRHKRIRGLIDHHALSESFASEKPVYMDVRPWGSMSTIIAHAFIRSNREMPKAIARILLAAILSDTLRLQSVTTTNADRMLVTLLTILGEVDDPDELAKRMFRAKTAWIVNQGAYEMVRGDQKDFSCNGWTFGIAVLEVTSTDAVLAVADELLLELRILKVEKGDDADTEEHDRRKELDFAFLFVVDIVRQSSVLIVCGGRELALARAAFPSCPLRSAKPDIVAPGDTISADETLMDVGALVSRKAQFVPAFFAPLSAGFTCHKQPMSSMSESEARCDPEDAAHSAMMNMKRQSYHDSVQVVRDYARLSQAFMDRKRLEVITEP